ncbi:MAG: tetratricopeptide repeat protein [Isosphaeraceae bacterium]
MSSRSRSRRLNFRALAIIGVVLVAALPGAIGLKVLQERRGRSAYLQEAKSLLAKKQPALALSYLNRYLVMNPRDREALELKGNLLADVALRAAKINRSQAQDQLVEASQTLNLLLGVDPADPKRLETRRTLLKLNIETNDRAPVAAEQAEKLLVDVLKITPPKGTEREAILGAVDKLSAAAPAAGAPSREDVAELLRLSARAYEYLSTYGGDEKVAQERLARARQDYQAAERLSPGDVSGAEMLSTLYLRRLKDPAHAKEVLDRLVSSSAGDPKRHAAALLARHRFYNELTTLTETPREEVPIAVANSRLDIEQSVKDDPTNVEALVAAAGYFLSRRDTQAARRYLMMVPAENRDDRNVRMTEGLVDLAELKRDEAIQTWRAGLLKAGGTDADLTWKLASVLLESNRREEAEPLIEQYGRLVGGKNPSPRYQFLKGFSLLKANRPAEAVTVLEPLRATINRSESGESELRTFNLQPSLYYLLGQAYEACGDPANRARALETYRQAAEMSQEWSPPWQAAARLTRETQPAEAILLLRRGLALNPSEPRLLADLAQLLYRAEMAKPEASRTWGEIERLFQDAKKHAPGSPEVALVEADYRAATGRWDEAVGLLEIVSRLHPESVEVWLARVSAAVRRNQYAQALAVLDEAITKAGHRSDFYVARATVLALKGDVTRTREALTEGLARCPVDQRPAILKALGDLHKARKDFTSARAAYEEWARLRPDDPAPRVGLVDLAIASGDEEAIAKAIEGIRGIGGNKGHYWQYARVEDLLRVRPNAPRDPARDAARIKEARALVDEIKTTDPTIALGPILEGRVCEREGKVDDAVAAYKAALKLDPNSAPALNLLTNLLVREKRDGELEALRDSLGPEAAGSLDKLAAAEALRSGNKSRAEQLAALAVEGNPQGVDLRLWQASVLSAVDKPKEAEEAIRKVIAGRPADPAPWLQLLMLQVSQGRNSDAAATVEKIREQVQSNYPQLLLAQCYRVVGNIARAGECYQEALRRWPNDAAVIQSAVVFYQQAGLRDNAEMTLRAVLRRDPTNAWAIRTLALSLASHANDQAAWEEALKLIGPKPTPNDTAEDLVARARVYGLGPTSSDRREALKILEGLLTELPELAAVHDLAARLYDAEGLSDKAREHAAKATAGDQAAPESLLFHANLLVRLKDLDGAQALIDRLSKADPTSLPVAEQRARLLAARGKTAEAAQVMEKAFEARTGSPDATIVGKEIVRLLRGWGQTEAADRVARRIAEVSTFGRCVLAEQLALDGKVDEAAAQLEQAAKDGDPDAAGGSALTLSLQPKADPRWLGLADRYLSEAVRLRAASPILHEKLALVKHLEGKFAEEIALYHTILNLNPASFEFLNNMAWTLSEEMDQPAEGLKWADEAVKRAGPKAAILDTRGVILTRLGQHDKAVTDLENATREAPVGPFFYHLARACKKGGRDADWKKYRDRAKQAGLTRDQLQKCELGDFDVVMGGS